MPIRKWNANLPFGCIRAALGGLARRTEKGGRRGTQGNGRWEADLQRNERSAGAWGGGHEENFAINPLTPMDHSRARFQAPRCGARTPTGTPCQRRAIRGRKRCRLHGGLSPGAPRGQKNGNFKTGNWTIEAIEERNWLRSLVRSFAKPMRTE